MFSPTPPSALLPHDAKETKHKFGKASPEPTISPEPWNGVITIQVSFPALPACYECCDNYEDIEINALTDTVKQVKDAIATRLGIEADEFVFYHKSDEAAYKPELDTLFATNYIRGNHVSLVCQGFIVDPYEVFLYKSKFYKEDTGMLKWLLCKKKDSHDKEHLNEAGMLAKRFAKLIADFKAQNNRQS